MEINYNKGREYLFIYKDLSYWCFVIKLAWNEH